MSKKKSSKEPIARQRVCSKSERLDIEEIFDGRTLDDVQAEFNALAHKYEREIFEQDLEVRFEVEYYGHDGGHDVYLYSSRWETDEEFKKRQAMLEAERAARRRARERVKEAARKNLYEKEADERAEFERLKAKFGKE